MEPFINVSALTPHPGRLKCVWITGADGRLECIWVPDWERDLEAAEAERELVAEDAPQPVRRAG